MERKVERASFGLIREDVRRVGWRKNLVWMLVVALLFCMTMVGVGTSSSCDPYVYVHPWISCAEPCETFDIRIKAGVDEWQGLGHEVEDLFLAEIYLSFDPGILNIVDDPATPDIEGINPDDQPNSLEAIHYEKLRYNAITGLMEIRLVAGRPLGVKEGLSGTVGMAKITFHVSGDTSNSILKFNLTVLRNSKGEQIEHYVKDGHFKNIYPTLWIRKKGARGVGVWPEWHIAVWYDCLTITLYARIANTGEECAIFKVKFIVTDPTGVMTGVESSVREVCPGETETVYATYHVPMPGVYRVVAAIDWEFKPDVWVQWEDVEDIFGGEGTSRDVGTGWFKAK